MSGTQTLKTKALVVIVSLRAWAASAFRWLSNTDSLVTPEQRLVTVSVKGRKRYCSSIGDIVLTPHKVSETPLQPQGRELWLGQRLQLEGDMRLPVRTAAEETAGLASSTTT